MNSLIVCNSQSVPVKVLVFVVQLTVVGFVKSVVYISGTNTYLRWSKKCTIRHGDGHVRLKIQCL